MQTSADLKNILARIDRRGYPAYKDTKGAYRFSDYILSIDHVQGDPFAAPSQLSIRVEGRRAAFPPRLYRMERHCTTPKRIIRTTISRSNHVPRTHAQTSPRRSSRERSSGKISRRRYLEKAWTTYRGCWR